MSKMLISLDKGKGSHTALPIEAERASQGSESTPVGLPERLLKALKPNGFRDASAFNTADGLSAFRVTLVLSGGAGLKCKSAG